MDKFMVVVKGSDQVSISSKLESRDDPTVVRNHGKLLVEVARSVQDGEWLGLLRCYWPVVGPLEASTDEAAGEEALVWCASSPRICTWRVFWQPCSAMAS